MAPRWFETPVDDIAVHRDNAHLAPTVAALGEWSVHADIAMFDGRTVKQRPTRGTGDLKPAESKVPWDPKWNPPSTAGGNYDQICFIDEPDGRRCMVWMPQYPARLFGLFPLSGTLGCGYAVRISGPAVDKKGRVVPGAPVDLRTYRGNDPRCNGGGVIPRPVTGADVASGRIAHALSCYVPAVMFGRDMVMAPAGKAENSGKGLPSVAGLRVSWRFDDSDLDDALGHLEARHRSGAWVLAHAMREFGATVDMTGPNPGIVCATDVGLPRDALDGVLDRVEWVVHEPPHGYRAGVDLGTGPGWYDDIAYRAAA